MHTSFVLDADLQIGLGADLQVYTQIRHLLHIFHYTPHFILPTPQYRHHFLFFGPKSVIFAIDCERSSNNRQVGNTVRKATHPIPPCLLLVPSHGTSFHSATSLLSSTYPCLSITLCIPLVMKKEVDRLKQIVIVGDSRKERPTNVSQHHQLSADVAPPFTISNAGHGLDCQFVHVENTDDARFAV
ncbi:hypothetical protein BLNAU_5223 [Blattamonas nauphoetae]|uniref:Uncharacterized protein n=1 Tax=Blattamonas nauphoetae TaxID=2049346 RepID=A0ABQ9Y7S3_9EUKA|nr:hypothetical protein BLNAU_5223 [Blattamonas nauphoetae]